MLKTIVRVTNCVLSRPATSYKQRGFLHYSSLAPVNKPKQSTSMPSIDTSLYVYPNDTPVCSLDCIQAFNALSEKEKKYAHHLAKASFDGSLAVFSQVSRESPSLFYVLYNLFSSESIEVIKSKATSLGWTDDEFTALLVFTAGFYTNSGNYKGFGDTKIVPDVSKEKVRLLLEHSEAAKKCEDLLHVYGTIEERLFALGPKDLQLGFPDQGVTGYLSEAITSADTDLIKRYFQSAHLEGWNTRLAKRTLNGKQVYVVRLASEQIRKGEQKSQFEGNDILFEYGDYANIFTHVIRSLNSALLFVANDHQKHMLEKYIAHFTTGNIDEHKDGSRHWIQDVGPSVESYIGFIENYRDPSGIRAEFEGFVAAVNKECSKKFKSLVDAAEVLLERLPWEKEYEKDRFLKPDFTALDVIAFGGSGIPAGINIPNYDSIRQDEGFKNVSLGNVIAAMPKQKINFLVEKDQELYLNWYREAFEVQVGLHELLGHGSGKLLQKNNDGTFNFDRNLKDMITGQQVTSWYEPGETWSSKFGALSSAYEECRAEAVGYFLCTFPDVLKIFGHEGKEADTVKYVNWMSEIRAGLLSLQMYSPESKCWGQAHSFARYALLQVCLEAGEGFVTIIETMGEDGKADLLFKLDPAKIDSVGKPAVAAFLRKLQAYKATGNNVEGSKWFNEVGAVRELNLKWRDIVVARRQPRRLFVQANTVINHKGDVEMRTYPETCEGIIQSFVERYTPNIVAELQHLSATDPDFACK